MKIEASLSLLFSFPFSQINFVLSRDNGKCYKLSHEQAKKHFMRYGFSITLKNYTFIQSKGFAIYLQLEVGLLPN